MGEKQWAGGKGAGSSRGQDTAPHHSQCLGQDVCTLLRLPQESRA